MGTSVFGNNKKFELQTTCSQTHEETFTVVKAKLLGKTFIHSHFNSAPLI